MVVQSWKILGNHLCGSWLGTLVHQDQPDFCTHFSKVRIGVRWVTYTNIVSILTHSNALPRMPLSLSCLLFHLDSDAMVLHKQNGPKMDYMRKCTLVTLSSYSLAVRWASPLSSVHICGYTSTSSTHMMPLCLPLLLLLASCPGVKM